MIDSRELRIGNWVDCYGIRFQIHELLELYATRNSEDGAFFYDKMEPIPLTPEILEKAGFEYEDMGGDSPYERWICKNYKELWVWDFNGEEWMFCLGDAFERGGFHYLHQLQNLYFALTQTEITINLK